MKHRQTPSIMRTLALALALSLTSVASHAEGLLQVLNDPQAKAAADELARQHDRLGPLEQLALERRLASMGYPAAMLRMCQYSDSGGPRWMTDEGTAWCRVIVEEAPDKETRLKEPAQKILDKLLPGSKEGARADATVRKLKAMMARPWRETAAEAAADFTPTLEQVGELPAGGANPDAALQAFIAAVNQHDNAAFEAVANPLDVYRLRKQGSYEKWRDWVMMCKIAEPQPAHEFDPAMKRTTRYETYPLDQASATRACPSQFKPDNTPIETAPPTKIPTTYNLIQLRGRWYVMQ